MKQTTSAFLLIFLAILLAVNASQASDLYTQQAPGDSTYNHLYKKGMKIVKDHPMRALNIWLSAKSFGKAHDPRIGIHFVETVTQHNMKQFYNQASEIYFWGIGGHDVNPYHDELLDELKRLQPLMNEGRYKKLRDLLDDNDPRFYQKLRLFWQEHDPLPSTPKNEYLLTVWERIAFAQKNFTKGHYSAYGTDARGPVYVKFGKPDHTEGNINANMKTYQSTSGNSFAALSNFTPRGGFKKSGAKTNKVFRLCNKSPDLHFWKYDRQRLQASRKVLYIFGRIPCKATRFDVIESLDQLIPDRLRQKAGHRKNVINMRKRIYQQYRTVDPLFMREYQKMLDLTLTRSHAALGNTQSWAHNNEARTTAELELPRSEAKPVTRPEGIPDFKSNIKTYRFWNAGGHPYAVAVIYSFPEKLLAANKYNEAISGVNSKKVISHTLQVISPDEDSLQMFQNVPKMELSSSVIGDRAFPVVSIFKLSHEPAGTRLRGTAELISYHHHQNGTNKVSFIGLHDENQKLNKNKLPDKNRWFVSDPVLGYQKEDVKLKSNPFSFYPAPEHIIPHGKDIHLYFELYDFGAGSDRRKPYRVSYSIGDKKGMLGSIFGGKDNQKVTIRQQKSSSVESNRIEIKTSSLTTGNYVLHVEIENPKTGRTIKRDIDFEVK